MPSTATLGEILKPAVWDTIFREGRRLLQRLLELETPIIAAVNGPANVHSEYALLADIVVASEDLHGQTPPRVQHRPR